MPRWASAWAIGARLRLVWPIYRGFVAGLGCYDRVLAYDEIAALAGSIAPDQGHVLTLG